MLLVAAVVAPCCGLTPPPEPSEGQPASPPEEVPGDTNPAALISHMRLLLQNPREAQELGREAQRYARQRFNIHRFVHDWNEALFEAVGHRYERYVA